MPRERVATGFLGSGWMVRGQRGKKRVDVTQAESVSIAERSMG